MDFVTGQKEAEASSYDELEPKTLLGKFWAWLVRDVPLIRFDGRLC